MLVTVVIVVVTDNLAIGVLAGVLLSAILFAAKISRVKVIKRDSGDKITFDVQGQLFFASAEEFVNSFDFDLTHTKIILNFSEAQIWDDSGIGAVDKVVIKYRAGGNEIAVKGLNPSSETIINKLAVYRDANAQLKSH